MEVVSHFPSLRLNNISLHENLLSSRRKRLLIYLISLAKKYFTVIISSLHTVWHAGC